MKELLFDSEAKIMEILWDKGSLCAKEISQAAAETIGWNKNTTYTVLNKLVAKGYVRREEPNFVCVPLLTRKQARQSEVKNLIDKAFGGSRRALFSALLTDELLSEDELAELRRLIEER